MDKKRPDYFSYLLRVWRSNGEDEISWQVSLESPHTGERIGFASLDELFAFLRHQTGVVSAPRGDIEEKEDFK